MTVAATPTSFLVVLRCYQETLVGVNFMRQEGESGMTQLETLKTQELLIR